MNIFYNNVDITKSCDVKKADIVDNAGRKADSIELLLADTENQWSAWGPKKGDEIEISESGFSSGTMYIDELWQLKGMFKIRAIATPLDSKTPKFRSWENIQFLKVAEDLVEDAGLVLQTFNIQNYTYDRVDQLWENDIECLNRLCIREGYALKISNGKAIIYDEKQQENTDSITTLYKANFIGDYAFGTVTNGLKQKCILNFMDSNGKVINSEFSCNIAGGILKKGDRVSNQAEADRFVIGYLRDKNIYEYIGNVEININSNLAAGNIVTVDDVGMFDGIYYIDSIVHKLAQERSKLILRKPLEGY
jgi:hypothetical protein